VIGFAIAVSSLRAPSLSRQVWQSKLSLFFYYSRYPAQVFALFIIFSPFPVSRSSQGSHIENIRRLTLPFDPAITSASFRDSITLRPSPDRQSPARMLT
jgi:hypothetical protein